MKDRQLVDVVREYVELLDSTPNAWGEHLHAIYGASHNMLGMMWNTFGKDNVNSEVTKQMMERRVT